jgi:hypothetical protein
MKDAPAGTSEITATTQQLLDRAASVPLSRDAGLLLSRARFAPLSERRSRGALLFEQHKRLAVQPGQLDHGPEKAARREVEGHDVVLTHAVQVIIWSEPQSPRPPELKCWVRREDAH